MSMRIFLYDVNNDKDDLVYSTDAPYNDGIIAPKLKLEVNTAGSLEFTILPTHPLYNSFSKLVSILRVFQESDLIFRGRVLSITTDFYNQRKIVCEGELAFLLDSVMKPIKGEKTIKSVFSEIITNHNAQMGDNTWKTFSVGEITVPNATKQENFEITSYKDTSSVLFTDLLEEYGGVVSTRHGIQGYSPTVIDYLEDPSQSSQNYDDYKSNDPDIAFGLNLLDLELSPPVDEIFTVLYPIGDKKEDSDEAIDISGVNPDNDPSHNKLYLYNDQMIAKYGKIYRCEQWSEIKDPSKLYEKASSWMNKHCKEYPDDMTIKAIDLHYLDPNNHPYMKLLDKVRCYSEPHGIDIVLVCLSIELDIQNPESSSYKIGSFIPSDKHKGDKITKKSTTTTSSGCGTKHKGISSKSAGANNSLNEFKADANKQIRIAAEKIEISATDIASINARKILIGGTEIKLNAETIELDGALETFIGGYKIQIGDKETDTISLNAKTINITGMIENLIVAKLNAEDIETVTLAASSSLVGDKITANTITAITGMYIKEKNPDGQEYDDLVATQGWVNKQNYSISKIYDEKGNIVPNMNITTATVTDINGNNVLVYIVPAPQ